MSQLDLTGMGDLLETWNPSKCKQDLIPKIQTAEEAIDDLYDKIINVFDKTFEQWEVTFNTIATKVTQSISELMVESKANFNSVVNKITTDIETKLAPIHTDLESYKGYLGVEGGLHPITGLPIPTPSKPHTTNVGETQQHSTSGGLIGHPISTALTGDETSGTTEANPGSGETSHSTNAVTLPTPLPTLNTAGDTPYPGVGVNPISKPNAEPSSGDSGGNTENQQTIVNVGSSSNLQNSSVVNSSSYSTVTNQDGRSYVDNSSRVTSENLNSIVNQATATECPICNPPNQGDKQVDCKTHNEVAWAFEPCGLVVVNDVLGQLDSPIDLATIEYVQDWESRNDGTKDAREDGSLWE